MNNLKFQVILFTNFLSNTEYLNELKKSNTFIYFEVKNSI